MKSILLFFALLLVSAKTFSQSSFCTAAIKEDSVRFSKSSVFLSSSARKKLDTIAIILKEQADCRIVVTGYGNNCMTCQQTSWDRTFSVIKYLRQKGVDSLRFIFSAAQDGGNPLIVTMRNLEAGEDGPPMIAPFHPCYSYHRLTKKRCKGSH